MEEKIILKTVYDSDCYDEIVKISYENSKDTVKKGDPIDSLSLICGWLAIVCTFVMVYFGVSGRFTMTMKFLIVVYMLIMIWCFVRPIQFFVSKCLWKSGFEKRFPINRGAGEDIVFEKEAMTYTNPKGEEVKLAFAEMYSIYDTLNYVILHNNDREIFLIRKDQLTELGIADMIYELLSDHPGAEWDSIEEEAQKPKLLEAEDVAEEMSQVASDEEESAENAESVEESSEEIEVGEEEPDEVIPEDTSNELESEDKVDEEA